MTIDILSEEGRWASMGLEAIAGRVWPAVQDRLGLGDHEVALLLASDDRIAALNADFRGKPQPTNVLSWPQEDLAPVEEGGDPLPPTPGSELGDIALAFETCMKEAADQGKPAADHVTHLLLHGLLHLLGYDHERDGDATLMEALEVEILGNLGLSDPYSPGD